MLTKNKVMSVSRIHRLKVQGYSGYSDSELTKLAFGNRFAYSLCFIILVLGIFTTSIPLLLLMTLVAFGGIILPFHPFDYLYNKVIRHRLRKPELPPRSKQIKFACTIATIWLIATVYLFYADYNVVGYVFGSLLAAVALIVSTTDICIPSIVYNFLNKINV